ncbi:HAD family hydrolase [Thermophilibacter sp.]|uniref:HAD family hydrolase n=1 Tax=Thermophilibacter sp. TaxID=2847309 RepID=UPI003A90C1DF
MDRKLRAIVFDMGNVLMTFDGAHFASRFTDTPEDAALLNGALFAAPIWALLDSGTVSHETARRVAAAHLPKRLHPNLDECFRRWPELSEPLQDVNDLAIRLKGEGYKIYVLSNANVNIMEQLGHAPAASHLDGVVVSGIERIMKPDPAIFRLLCERYELAPEACLFVDDNADNCEGARVAGMHAYHFTGDAAELEATIRALG